MKTLIVDDFMPIANIWKTILMTEGFSDITILTDGNAVLDFVDTERPELILTDINLSNELNGIELAEKIMAKWPLTRIMVISMHNQSSYIDAARRAGASGYLTKQASIEEFKSKLKIVTEGGLAF